MAPCRLPGHLVLKLLEQHIGHRAAAALLEEGLERPLTFREYPRDAGWLLEKRRIINRKLAELAEK
jgi:hypothetical protein